MPSEPRRRRFGPIAPPPGEAIAVAPGEALLLPCRLTAEAGERRGREVIQEGLLRPADSHTADIEGAQLVWIPVWRVDLSADAFHVSVSPPVGSRRAWPLPIGGTRQRDAVERVSARRLLPFDITPRLALPLEALVAWSAAPAAEGEVLSPDLGRDEAVAEATARARRAVESPRAVYRDLSVRVRSVALCHVPVWLRRYRYTGEASPPGEAEDGHVAISGWDGSVLSERHPSAMRALAGRVKRLFRRP
jgi:hypothetical protein